MARVKGGVNAKRKHNKVLSQAKGYKGARSKQYRVAKQSVMRAMANAYRGRKERKRQFRSLWITRINAGARINGLSYSVLMHGLSEAGVEINRKMLSELAISDPAAFARLCDLARTSLGLEGAKDAPSPTIEGLKAPKAEEVTKDAPAPATEEAPAASAIGDPEA